MTQNPPSAAEIQIRESLGSLRRSSFNRIAGHPAIKEILAGKASRDVYIGYLKNVYHYATHSAVVIGMAGARAVHQSKEVAEYLLHHATEETGHELWALSDLRDLGLSDDEVLASRPTQSCMAMIGMEYYWAAHANPVALLGWMYSLEALGDDVGHLMAEKLSEGLALGGKGTYFLSGHGTADHEHIQDITRVIVNHVHERDLSDLFYVAECGAKYYEGIISDVLIQ